MTDPASSIFRVGRADLLTDATLHPFPQKLRQPNAMRLDIAGVYYPDPSGSTHPDAMRLLGRAFVHQWLGLNEEPDAVPLVSTRAPELSGAYRVRSASVDWLKFVTDDRGIVHYAAELERVRPTSAAAVSEVQVTSATRSTAVHAVSAEGLYMLPRRVVHQNAGDMQIFRPGDDGYGTHGKFSPASPFASSFQFGIDAANYYAGGCAVEIRQGPSAPWYPVHGRQIPPTNAADLRITNGGIRVTWDGRRWATADAGVITLEQSLGDPGGWSTVAEFTMTHPQNWRPIGTPSIIRNRPDSVAVKYPCDNLSNGQSHYISIGIGRGATFATLSALSDRKVTVVEASNPTATTLTGGRRSTNPNADGYHWIVCTPEAFTTPASTVLEVAAGVSNPDTPSPRSWAFGVTDDGATADERRSHTQVVAQWWAGVSTTQRFVGL